jgi:acyl-CoA thioester hydrolase
MRSEDADSRPGALPLARERFRVAMSDTDAAQVIYFGAPTRWTERLVTTWLADVKHPTSELLAAGFGMPAVRAELTYRGPLRLDDLVDASLWLHAKSARSVTWRAEFAACGESLPAVVVLLTQVYARLGAHRPVPVPWPDTLAELFGEESRPAPADSGHV